MKKKLRVKISAEVLVCCDEVGEENLSAITDKIWYVGTGGRSGMATRDERGGGDWTAVETRARAVNGFGGFVVCNVFARGDLAVLCRETIWACSWLSATLKWSHSKRRMSSML